MYFFYVIYYLLIKGIKFGTDFDRYISIILNFINRLIYNHIKYQNDRMNKYPPQFGYSMNKNGSIKLDNPELECYMRLFYDNYHEFGYDRALNIFNKMNGIYKKLGSEPIPKAVMDKIAE